MSPRTPIATLAIIPGSRGAKAKLLGGIALCLLTDCSASADLHPRVVRHGRQEYVAIRTSCSLLQLTEFARNGISRTASWMHAYHIRPSGPPFVRYLAVDMPKRMEIAIGFPVDAPTKTGQSIEAGFFPAGRYVEATFNGPYEGLMGANADVAMWARKHGFKMVMKQGARGEEYGARAEFYLNDPDVVRDPTKFRTRISILVSK